MSAKRSKENCRMFIVLSLLLGIMFLSIPVKAMANMDPPEREVLLIASGYYDEEDDIENRLVESGIYKVTRAGDYQFSSTADLSGFDLIILTGFAPNLSTSALENIEASGKPIFIIEYWEFEYSHRLGLLEYGGYDYYRNDTVYTTDDSSLIPYFGESIQVYNAPYTIYSAASWDLTENVVPLIKSSESYDEYPVIMDTNRNILTTGIYKTDYYTTESWMMFDLIVTMLAENPADWSSLEETMEAYQQSGLQDYIANLNGETPAELVETVVITIMNQCGLLSLNQLILDELKVVYASFDFQLVPKLTLMDFHPTFDESDPDSPQPGFCSQILK